MIDRNKASRWLLMLLVSIMATASPAARDSGRLTGNFRAADGAATTLPAVETKPFQPEELEALAAPIALYPDSLVAQILMASTYPLEIVQADRWAQGAKELKGDALTAELNKKEWDPSVKSLVNFPQVLTMMSTQLDWTTKLGDAFIADQKAMLAAVQRLRAKAQATGNLKTTQEQKVIVEPVAETQTQIIKIESPSPEVVYVPTYSPTVVYGTWPYPAYPPPPPYYPPGYVASNMISFGAGVAVGAAWGHAWGGCNWGGGEVDIDVNRNTNINQNISASREKYKQNMQQRSTNRTGTGTGTGARQTSASSFQHDPSHRKGVSYRDNATARDFGGAGSTNASQARQDFRGRAETGRQDIARGGADSFRAAGGGSPSAGLGSRSPSASPGVADRSDGVGRSPSAGPSVSDRSAGGRSPSANSGGAFDGARSSGSAARAQSDRGSTSRASAGSAGGASRSGGGSSRGGGGGRR